MKNAVLPVARVARWVSAAALAAALVPATAWAQPTDVTPPQLQSFALTPASIDVSLGYVIVHVTLGVTDDLSGFGPPSSAHVEFLSPSNGQARQAYCMLVPAGTPLTATCDATAVFPQYSEAGTWRVSHVDFIDLAGNQAKLHTDDLEALGLPAHVEVVSVPSDIAPPQLTGLAFTPAVIDTSAAGQSVQVTLGITDDLAGVGPWGAVQVRFRSPSGSQLRDGVGVLSAGTSLNGTWEATVSFPQFSEAGTWTVDFVSLRDVVTNMVWLRATDLESMGFPTGLDVVSIPSDTAHPQLTGFTFTPTLIDSSAGAGTVAVELNITDDLSGVGPWGAVQVRFMSPSGSQFHDGVGVLSTGTSLDGTWEATINFPQFSEAGTWTVDFVILRDLVTNTAWLRAADLETVGFPAELVVIRPSLIADGTVSDPAAGGTVADDTFGARAQVTFPPGVLGAPTDVAIDVFEDPLDVAIPQGYLAAGTHFVNIALVPEPTFPLPAPGLTVVLPLVRFKVPGTTLALYRIDPATGLLVPALDWAGLPVVGTVDAPDGLSATFTGIARLSTVVGLLPAQIIVRIDIKPGDSRNTINLSSKGVVPVAILTTTAFDAASVDPWSVTLAGAAVRLHGKSGTAGSLEDVDGDGDLDLLVHVEATELALTEDDTEAVLEGQTIDGVPIEGRDSVRIVPVKAGKTK